jgi:hypothetical protein
VQASLPPTKAWPTPRGATPRRKRLHCDAWGIDSPRHASAPAGGRRGQLTPTGALIRPCSAAQPSHRHHLQPCSTQAPPEALKHPYDELRPTVRSQRGGLVQCSDGLSRRQTTRKECKASRSEHPRPTTRRVPRQCSATPLQCVLRDSDAREDILVTDNVTLIFFPFVSLPLASIKERGGQPSQGLADEPNTHSKGLGSSTLSRPICNPYYK